MHGTPAALHAPKALLTGGSARTRRLVTGTVKEFLRAFAEAGQDGPQFRGIPFWSWNDRMDPDELRRQVRAMKAAGLGGAFMHARVGLETLYMGDEWMACIAACIDEGQALDFGAWLYDEDCWPSGSAGGRVPALGEEYLQKGLAWDDLPPEELEDDPREIARFAVAEGLDGPEFTRFVGPAPEGTTRVVRFSYQATEYVDLLSPEVTRAFIREQYEPYAARFAQHFGGAFRGTVPGIFTDEPQYHPLPWSFALPEAYTRMWARDLVDDLPSLFDEVGDYSTVRHHYYATAGELFVEGFSKQIGEWCDAHDLDFTGHVMAEDTLLSQTAHCGAAMSHYEYMSIPGIDHLSRQLGTVALCKQVSSVARQMGGRRVLSEMFGCAGWNVSLEELKWIAEWQFALGVSLVCQHLSLYSLRGCRKRDYPPSLHVQQPYFPDLYKLLNDRFARSLMALTWGDAAIDVLVLHPISTAWMLWDATDYGQAEGVWSDFEELSRLLVHMQRDFDYGDERMMRRHGRVEGQALRVGEAAYRLVIVPPMTTISRPVLGLLNEFVEAGGAVISVGEDPTFIDGVADDSALELLSRATHIELDPHDLARAIDESDATGPGVILDGHGTDFIAATHRIGPEGHVFFLANTSPLYGVEFEALLPVKGLVHRLCPDTGAARALPCRESGDACAVTLSLAPMESVLLFVEEGKPHAAPEPGPHRRVLGEITPPWRIEPLDLNAITLDRCCWRLPGEDWSDPIEVIHLQRLLEERPEEATVHLRFDFDLDVEPNRSDLELVLESPETMRISINGQHIESLSRGPWLDQAFRRVAIDRWVRRGANSIELTTTFTPRSNLTGEPVHESVGNRARPETELESVYLRGRFEVESASGWVAAERNTRVSGGPFKLIEPRFETEDGECVTAGYPFYAGRLRLSQTLTTGELPTGQELLLSFERPAAIGLRVLVNGVDLGTRCWAPFEFATGDALRVGENELVVELCGSLRNLLGPHHHTDLEPYGVGPGQFERGERDWLDEGRRGTAWIDEHAFVAFGILFEPKLIATRR